MRDLKALWRDPLLIFTALTLISLPFDHRIARLMTNLSPEAIDIGRGIAVYGRAEWYLLPSLFFFVLLFTASRTKPWLRQGAEMAGFVLLSVAAAGLAVDVLKHLIGRPRPPYFLAHPDSGLHPLTFAAKFASFPSGHTAVVVAFAMAMSAVFAPHSPGVRWPLYLWAGIMGLCRIIGVDHYPSDVFAGAAIAIFTTRRMIRWGLRREILIFPKTNPFKWKHLNG
jgi:undecaprenyl-diphosphatase